MTNELIDLNILPIETLAEMANEKAELVEKNARKTVSDAIDCGRYLTAIKDQTEHGQWAAWLGVNFNYSQVTAWRYMSLAAKSFTMKDLGNAKNVNDALRLIAEEKEPAREHRIPDRVEVVDHIVDTNKKVDASTADDDPAPDPPTIRKTAKGSEKVAEDKKPRTQPIVPEIMADDEPDKEMDHSTGIVKSWLSANTLEDVIVAWGCNGIEEKSAMIVAKTLRKMADKYDPPDETSAIPKATELKSHIPDELPETIDAALWQFVKLKQGYKDRKWRYQSVDQFVGDMKRLKNKLKALGEKTVERMLLDAFDKGWRHWDHDLQNGKVNGNGHTESLADRVASKAAKLKDIFG